MKLVLYLLRFYSAKEKEENKKPKTVIEGIKTAFKAVLFLFCFSVFFSLVIYIGGVAENTEIVLPKNKGRWCLTVNR